MLHCLEIPGVQPSKPDHAKCGYSNDRWSKLHMEAMEGKGNQGVIRHSRSCRKLSYGHWTYSSRYGRMILKNNKEK